MTNRTTSHKVLLSIAAFAAILVATGSIAIGVTQPAAAQTISTTTSSTQANNCGTVGGSSSVSGSCTASATNSNTQSGGVAGAVCRLTLSGLPKARPWKENAA